ATVCRIRIERLAKLPRLITLKGPGRVGAARHRTRHTPRVIAEPAIGHGEIRPWGGHRAENLDARTVLDPELVGVGPDTFMARLGPLDRYGVHVDDRVGRIRNRRQTDAVRGAAQAHPLAHA